MSSFFRFLFGDKLINNLSASLFLTLGLALAIELCGQIYVSFFPGYRNISLIPDLVLGWKFIPNGEFTETGTGWYAEEFSAKTKINSQGFRDVERKAKKEKNVYRIAVLGDSMVAARQVDFSKTATQLLEKKLNDELGEVTKKKFEVFNFGVGAYGMSQYYLTWKDYASKFKPDIVFAYISEYAYFRTISLTRCHDYFKTTGESCLSTRPVFTLTLKFPHFINPKFSKDLDELYLKKEFSEYFSKLIGQRLFFVYPKDYGKYVQAQETLINTKFDGKRAIPKKRKWFLTHLLRRVKWRLKQIQTKYDPKITEKAKKLEENKYTGKSNSFPAWIAINHVNLRLISFLSKDVREKGAKFVALNAFKFKSKPSSYIDTASEFLYQLSLYYGFAHIPLDEKLNQSAKNGNSPRWVYDGHFNETGNKIFAEEMYRHISQKFFPEAVKAD